MKKRLFDLTVTVLAMPLWLPVLAVCALAIWLLEGRPVIYRSMRTVHMDNEHPVIKFRTMVRNAEKIANRDTVPMVGTVFLNIEPDSELYTPIGRFIERFALTELPQLFSVFQGEMSLVGNRPLPRNVVMALRRYFPYAGDRLLSKAGMTGPVQLVGRDDISDLDRLAVEIDYNLICRQAYSIRLDFLILFYTVTVALHLRQPFTVIEVRRLMRRIVEGKTGLVPDAADKRAFTRFPCDLRCQIIGGQESSSASITSLSYLGMSGKVDSEFQFFGPIRVLVDAGRGIEEIDGDVVWARDGGGEREVGISFRSSQSTGPFLSALFMTKPTKGSKGFAEQDLVPR